MDGWETPDELLDELRELVGRLQDLGGEAASLTDALLERMDAFHRETLARLLRVVAAAGELSRALADPVITAALGLYEMDPVAERRRAEAALEPVRPYFRSHGGDVRVVAAAGGLVTVELLGACNGCPASRSTLERVIADALQENMPGFAGVMVASDSQPAGAVPAVERADGPVDRLPALPAMALGWFEVACLDDLPEGVLLSGAAGGWRLAIVRRGGDVYALQDQCALQPAPLSRGLLQGDAVVCPDHGCVYDLKTGRARNRPGLRVAPVPVIIRDGRAYAGIPVASTAGQEEGIGHDAP